MSTAMGEFTAWLEEMAAKADETPKPWEPMEISDVSKHSRYTVINIDDLHRILMMGNMVRNAVKGAVKWDDVRAAAEALNMSIYDGSFTRAYDQLRFVTDLPYSYPVTATDYEGIANELLAVWQRDPSLLSEGQVRMLKGYCKDNGFDLEEMKGG